jgi:pimeloyl-ACP methyl ester carboxylesterase
MNHQARAAGNLERRIHDAERDLFAAAGADVGESVLELAQTGLRVRVLCHGRGPAVVLLHGVSESAAIWAPLFTKLRHFRLLAVDLPGHGLSGPAAFRRGQVREHARRLPGDILDALGLDEVPVIGHSLGAMFALWHVAAGSGRICEVVAIGEPAVALPGVRVRMPLSLLTVRGLGAAVLRSPSPRCVYRHLLAQARSSPRSRHPRSSSSDPATPTCPSSAHGDRSVHGATLHEVPGGHAPWLVDPQRAAELITARSLSPARR